MEVASGLAAGFLQRRLERFLAMTPGSVARCQVPISRQTLISLRKCLNPIWSIP